MFIKMKLNTEELAALLALQVSEKNKDSSGQPFFRVTKTGASGNSKDRVEIQIIEFNVQGDDRENSLAIDHAYDEKHLPGRQGPNLGEPIPGELLLLIFNAIGRFPVAEAVPLMDSKPAAPLPLTPEFLTDFHSLISLLNEREEMAVKEWIKGIIHAYSKGDAENLRRWLESNLDHPCAMSFTLEEQPQAAKYHFNNLQTYFRRHCLGEDA